MMIKLFILVLLFSSCAKYEYDAVLGRKVRIIKTGSRGSCKGDGSVILVRDSAGKFVQKNRRFKFF
jgi:hypothetical protein